MWCPYVTKNLIAKILYLWPQILGGLVCFHLDVDIEPKGDDVLVIHVDTHVIASISEWSSNWIDTQRMKLGHAWR
jgi:hypothetical protein